MKTLEEIKDEAIIDRIKHFKGHRERAAISLGISIRTIRNVLARLRKEEPEIIKSLPLYEMTEEEKLLAIKKREQSSTWIQWKESNKKLQGMQKRK